MIGTQDYVSLYKTHVSVSQKAPESVKMSQSKSPVAL